MKAIVQTRYGPPGEVLELREVEKPSPKEGEALVRVQAAALHAGDTFGVRGSPFVVRSATGLLKPKYGPGYDLAGEVEAVGGGVSQFAPGDAVFGASTGTCAEYVCVKEDKLAPKPAPLTFEEAAALPTSGLAALHGLRRAGEVKPGQQVLINGASGGVGSFAVQIAKADGAEVTGVCSTPHVEFVRSLGADHVIDYTQEDFTEGGPRYDLILDNVENRSLADCRRALKPNGTLVLNSGSGAAGLGLIWRLLKPILLSPFSRQNLRRYLSLPKQEDLLVLKDLAEAGKLRPVIDRTYPLAETAVALSYLESRHAQGKVVIAVAAAG
jgi:NADPH:quinone reductase-like Zn-dependent oxidoreductase